jgi:hypothetical protein
VKKTHFNLVEKNGKVFVIDLDGKVMSPDKARAIAHGLLSTTEAPSYVYIGQQRSDNLYKIGKTDNLRRRSLELGIQFEHRIQCSLYGEHASFKVEAALHRFFKATGQHIEKEWFDLGDEGFSLITTYCHDAQTTLAFVDDHLPAVLELLELKRRCSELVFALLAAEFIERKRKDRAFWTMYLYFMKRLQNELREADPNLCGYLEGVSGVLGAIAGVRSGITADMMKELEKVEIEYQSEADAEGEFDGD